MQVTNLCTKRLTLNGELLTCGLHQTYKGKPVVTIDKRQPSIAAQAIVLLWLHGELCSHAVISDSLPEPVPG